MEPVAKRRFSVAWRLVLVALAVAAAVAPMPATAVERLYSTRIYPAVQAHLTAVSNGIGAGLLDIVAALALAGWLGALVADFRWRRLGWLRAAGHSAARTIVLGAGAYLAFVALWGLNYRRVPLADKLQFDAAAVSPAAARDLAATAIERLNALHERAHPSDAPTLDGIDPRLAEAFAQVQRDLGAVRVAVPGRPKHTLFDFYFRRAAVDGMTDPYFLEALVARDLLPFEQPFVVAHEWSHLAGYAGESEANFIGWLTCVRAGEAYEYSGWLFLYGELVQHVSAADRRRLPGLGPGPRADRQAIGARFRRNVSPTIAAAGWKVYDRYLKANRVEAGAASYGEVVRLALGTRFGPNWTPLLRSR